jgi:hypothetical protein
VIEQSGPEDKSVPVIDDGIDHELVLDEADEFGDIDEEVDGISIQDIDEIDEIKEEA